MKRIAIIGGGISGLVTAYRLSQSRMGQEGDLEIHVYEARDRFGGVIQTEEQNGLMIERGPDFFISTKSGVTELCQELGLEGEFTATNLSFRQSFILLKKNLIPVPLRFHSISSAAVSVGERTSPLSFGGKIRMVLELLTPPKMQDGDESLASFVRRRFGEEVLERIAKPMIDGIYTVEPEGLSLEETFPQFLKMERYYGSVMRALLMHKETAKSKENSQGQFHLALKGGLNSLIRRLIKQMPLVHFHASEKIIRLENKLGWKILSERGKVLEAEAVCLAIPAVAAAKLVYSLSRNLSRDLGRIPYGSAATVNLAFLRRDIHQMLHNLERVAPFVKKYEMARNVFSTSGLAKGIPESEAVLTRVFLGGKIYRELSGAEDHEILDTVKAEVAKQLKILAKPFSGLISRWSDAIPQYCVGHRKIVDAIFAGLSDFPCLYVTGNAYRGTGIPDCIRQASQTAFQIISELNKQAKSTAMGEL